MPQEISSHEFNYNDLEPDLALEAQSVVERVFSRTRAAMIENGRDFLRLKEKLGHGKFAKFVEANIPMTMRSVENCMQAARQLGDKYEIVSHLPSTLLYRIASRSTPAPVRAAVLEKLETDRLSAGEVRAMLAFYGMHGGVRRPAPREPSERVSLRAQEANETVMHLILPVVPPADLLKLIPALRVANVTELCTELETRARALAGAGTPRNDRSYTEREQSRPSGQGNPEVGDMLKGARMA